MVRHFWAVNSFGQEPCRGRTLRLVRQLVFRRLFAYAPALVWGALLLFIGGRSNVPAVETDLPLDKAAHFLLYGTLGMLLARGWVRAQCRPPAWVLVALALSCGVADEVNQSRTITRSPEVLDWVADALGIAAGFTLVARRHKQSEES